MRRRNPKLGIVELWARLRNRGYTRCLESLWRVLRRDGLAEQEKPKKKYQPKPYEQMQYPGQRVQIDVKVVLRSCIADPLLKLYQYTAIDEYSRYRILGAYAEQSTYSSAGFLRRVVAAFQRKGVKVECVQTDNGFEFTNRFSNSKRDIPTPFEDTAKELGIRHKLIRPYTPRHNGKASAVTVRIKSDSMTPIGSGRSPTLEQLPPYAPSSMALSQADARLLCCTK